MDASHVPQGAGNYICVPEAPKAPSKFEVFVGQMKKAPLFHFIRARLGAGSLPETKILDEENNIVSVKREKGGGIKKTSGAFFTKACNNFLQIQKEAHRRGSNIL